MNQSMPDCVTVETGAAVAAAVIWLHGLGADGHDFEAIVPQLRLPTDQPTRFVFPHAPMRPVTINNGAVMRAWYDITGFGMAERQDELGIRQSAEIVESLIRHEMDRGLSTKNIILAGFSQGGAIALHAGLRHPKPLAGILALSTYLPLPDRLATEAHEMNRNVPILMAHGSKDPVVPIDLARLSRDQLEQHGYAVSWHDYPIQHEVCQEEIAEIGTWLRTRLGA